MVGLLDAKTLVARRKASDMAATLVKPCPSCGSSHELIILVGNMADTAKRYEFTCPKSGVRVPLVLTDSDWWKTVEGRPAGAVVVREVGA